MKDLYLNTLRDTLTGETYQDGCVARRSLRRLLRPLGIHLGRPMSRAERHQGRVWPETGLTMVGTARLDNIRHCLESCIENDVPGAFVECGVWRGGASIFAAAVIEANGCNREVYLCDSFEGLPRPEHKLDVLDSVHFWKDADVLAVSEEQVRDNFRRFHLDHPNVRFIKGWFKDTLESLPCQQIAVLRADGDMYDSTREILKLHERISPGGFCIIDDYGTVEACRRAVDEFLSGRPELKPQEIDYASVYWRAPECSGNNTHLLHAAVSCAEELENRFFEESGGCLAK
jgi:O-methyltransferase